MSDVTFGAVLDQVEELLKAQENVKALEELERIKDDNSQPEEQIRHAHLSGVALSRLGRLDDAVLQFRRSRREAEKADAKEAVAQADEYLGSAYHQRNRLEEARFHYVSALGIWKELGNKEGQGRGYRNLGNLLVDKGDNRSALQMYNESCKFFRELGLKEDMAPAIMHRGTMAYAEKGIEAALEVYREGIEKDGCTHYLVMNNYGFILMLAEKYDEAIAALKAALENIEAKKIRDDDYALICLNLGVAASLTGKLEEAEKDLRTAADMLENYPQARAMEFLLQANEKYADKGFSKYLLVDNGLKKSLARLNLATVLVWNGKIEEAKAEIAKGLAADHSAGYPYLSAGWVHLAAGMEKEASSDFYNACGFEPKNEEFRKALNLVNPYIQAKVGRNDPCPCGSGKKFKKCHGSRIC